MHLSSVSRRRRLLGGGALVAAAAVALPVVSSVAFADDDGPSAAFSCDEGTELPAPDKAFRVTVEGMDPGGEYIVGVSYEKREGAESTSSSDVDVKDPTPDMKLRVLLWHDGEYTEVPPPEGLDTSVVWEYETFDVNAEGVVVGAAVEEIGQEPNRPWVHRDGETTLLPGVETGWVGGINAAGDIVGVRTDGGVDQPVIWTAESDYEELVELGLPEGAGSAQARDIGDDGVVVGGVEIDGVEQPFLWDSEAGDLLPRHPEDAENLDVLALQIRDGWVAGRGHYSDDGTPLRWNIASGKGDAERGELNEVQGVNAEGWTAGVKLNAPAIQTDEGVAKLDTPYDQFHGTAKRLSDDGGLVAGFADTDEIDDHFDYRIVRALVWTCAHG
ncbi:MAG: hypothetical protein ACRDXX_14005 [Stackebrandtia sp.]